MAHSPAPWVYSKEPWMLGEDDRFIRDASGEAIMCDTPYYPWCSSNEDDWPLMAAAPDLFEAVSAIIEAGILNPAGSVKVERAKAMLVAAKAKAEGRS